VRLFLHIPKTAGTSLSDVLQKAYGADQCFSNQELYARPDELAAAFCELPESQREKYEVLAGHYRYGFHELLPGEHKYMTFVRNPVDLVLSWYYFIRSQKNNPLHKSVVGSNMSLSQFVTTVAEMNNLMVRWLTGAMVGGRPIPRGACTPDMLEQAKHNLKERFCFVGVTEEFDRSVILMKREFGWSHAPLYFSRNVSKTRAPRESLTNAERDLILENSQLDCQLYDYVVREFCTKVSDHGVSFQNELDVYKGNLKDYQDLAHVLQDIEDSRLWRISRPLVNAVDMAKSIKLDTRWSMPQLAGRKAARPQYGSGPAGL